MTNPRQQLEQLCNQVPFKGTLHPVNYIDGLLFAAAAVPEIPMPEQWLVLVFKQHGKLASEAEAEKLTEVLLAVFKEHLRSMKDSSASLPTDCVMPNKNQSGGPLAHWMTGLLTGHSEFETLWHQSWELMLQQNPNSAPQLKKELTHCLSMFSTFANVPLAIEQAKQQGNEQLEPNLEKIFLALPKALDLYVQLSGNLAQYLPNQFESFTQPLS